MNITRAAAEFQALYTALGAYRPQRLRSFVPYAERVAYVEQGRAKHRVTARRSPLRWAASVFREAGESLVGAFLILAD